MSKLDDMRRRVRADLEDGQGRWRRTPLAWRVGALLLPAAVALVALALGLPWSHPVTSELASVVAAVVSLLLASASVVGMTTRPSASERLAQAALLACAAAFVLEATEATGTGWAMTSGCLSITVAVGVVVFGATIAVVRRTGFPLRMWHRTAVATSAVLAAGIPAWRHCPSRDLEHLVVAHAFGPTLLMVALAVLAQWAFRRRPLYR